MSLDIFRMYHYCCLLPEESFLRAVKSEFVCFLETILVVLLVSHQQKLVNISVTNFSSPFMVYSLPKLARLSVSHPPCNFCVCNESGTRGDDSIWWSSCAVQCSLLCATAAAEGKHFSTAFQVFSWLLSYLLQKKPLEHVFCNKAQEGWVKCPLNRMII